MSNPLMTPTGMPPGSVPAQGVHPTVPQGQTIPPQQQTQPSYSLPPLPPQQQQGTLPGQAVYTPIGQPQVQQPQAPQPPVQPAQQVPTGVDANQLLDGPNIPAELRGRTLGQALQIYSALASDWAMRNPRGGQTQAQSQAPQSQAPQSQPQRTAQSSAQDPDGQFWKNPTQTIREIVAEVASPMMQRTQAAAIQEARQIAAAGIPDFQQLEPQMMQVMAGADAQALSNPQFWINAADLARGQAIRSGQYGQMPVPSTNPHNQQFMRGPGAAVPAQSGLPPVHQFFTEGPTAPGINQMVPLTPQQRETARKMGMSDEEYLNWGGGIQRRTY